MENSGVICWAIVCEKKKISYQRKARTMKYADVHNTNCANLRMKCKTWTLRRPSASQVCAGSVNRTDRLGRVTRLQYYCVLLTNLFVISDTGMTSVPRSARNASRSYSVGLLATILVEYNVNHFDLCASNESATVRIASFLVYFSFFYLM